MTPGTTILTDVLAEIVSDALGHRASIHDLTRLKGGYSREMWAFDAVTDRGERHALVLCADNPSGVVERGTQSLDRVEEGVLLTELHGHGLPVPAVLCFDDDTGPLSRAFLVMARIPGTTAIGPLLRDEHYIARHDAFGAQKASILASIHAAPYGSALPSLLQPSAQGLARREAERWVAALAATPGARTEAIEPALAWLRSHEPEEPSRPVLVHGDYRTGNLMYGPDGIRAVLDWEMAHVGDPLEDVAWAQLICWRAGTPRVGVLVRPERWQRLYSDAGGAEIDPFSLRYWGVLSAVKMTSLIWRAVEATPEGDEQALLLRLFHELGEDLRSGLLG